MKIKLKMIVRKSDSGSVDDELGNQLKTQAVFWFNYDKI